MVVQKLTEENEQLKKDLDAAKSDSAKKQGGEKEAKVAVVAAEVQSE